MTESGPTDPGQVALRPIKLETADATFTVRRFRPTPQPSRTLIILDDELIGDAMIAAARLRAIDGSLPDTELLLVGFGDTEYGSLHQRRGASFTFAPCDLSLVGIETTGSASELSGFLREQVLPQCQSDIGLVGYSLSGLFAIDAIGALDGRCSYLAALSPSLWLDQTAEDRLAKKMAEDGNLRVFLGVGESEDDPIPGDDLSMQARVSRTGEELRRRFGERALIQIYARADHISVVLHAADRAILEF